MTSGLECIECHRVSKPRSHGISIAINGRPPRFMCMRCATNTPDAILVLMNAATSSRRKR